MAVQALIAGFWGELPRYCPLRGVGGHNGGWVSAGMALAKVGAQIDATRITDTFDGYRLRGACTIGAAPYWQGGRWTQQFASPPN